jgi:acyl-CoA synthetase (AMP-forming)/AMP-acid ligase II
VNTDLPLRTLRMAPLQPFWIQHENPEVIRILARYIGLLDSTTSILIAGHEPSGTALDDMDRIATNGLVVTDLKTYMTERRPPTDTRETEQDYGFIAFTTSGTSGNPKTVLYAKTTLLASAERIAETLGLHEGGTAVCYARTSLAYGLSVLHSHYLANHGVLFRRPHTDPFEFQQTLAMLPDPRLVYLLPIQAAHLVYGENHHDTRPITFLVAGALLPQTVADKLARRYPNATVVNMYGQSELGPRIAVWAGPVAAYREGVVGRPLPGVTISAKGTEVVPGTVWVASPYRMLRYLRGTAPSSSGLNTSRLHWTNTGDLGFINESGDLVVRGRNSGYANIAGEVVDVSAIESVVRGVAGVALCRVAVEQHPAYGELPLVRILPAERDTDSTSLVRLIRQQLHDHLGKAAALSSVIIVAEPHALDKL